LNLVSGLKQTVPVAKLFQHVGKDESSVREWFVFCVFTMVGIILANGMKVQHCKENHIDVTSEGIDFG
jgi:hypothetical protein